MKLTKLVLGASLLVTGCGGGTGAMDGGPVQTSDAASPAQGDDGGTLAPPDAGTDGSVAETPDGSMPVVAAGAPEAPTKLRMVLQGESSAGDTKSPPVPTTPDRTDLSWNASVVGDHPVDHYKIYRSTNGTTYTAYATSNKTSYSDTAAKGGVNGTAGATAPYYPATTYWYKVSAVDTAGTEGAQSTSQSFAVYEDGSFNWGGDFDFGGLTSNYADTSGAPQSGGKDIAVTVNGAYGGWLPYSGNLTTEWNMWSGAFTYLELDLKPTAAGQSWSLFAVRVGDVPIYDSTGTAYNVDVSAYGPAPVAGTWAHYKIPLAKILTDYGPSGAGPAAVEKAVYKFGLQDQTGKTSNTWYVNNVLYTP